jgi:hypothetical protein
MAKKCILLSGLLIAIMAVGSVFAQQAETLKEGIYQAQGSADEYYVNANYNYKRSQRGYYTLQGYAGSAKRKKVMLVVSGRIVGNELRTNVNKSDAQAFTEALGEDSDFSLPDGALLIYTIVDNETFLDPSGQRWIWVRQRK